MEDYGDRPKIPQDLTFKTPEDIAGYLALKHANGMSFIHILDLHTQILARLGRDYVKTWGPKHSAAQDVHDSYRGLKDGAYYVLSHLETDDEWYDDEPRDEL